MNEMDADLLRVVERCARREAERRMIAGIKVIRLELELLAKQDRIDELEASEWARLEPVEDEG